MEQFCIRAPAATIDPAKGTRNMANHRSQPRHELNVYLEVREADSGRAVGHVVDLTTGGMRLVTTRTFAQGAAYRLLIAVDIGPAGDKTVAVDAVCTWAGRDVNPDLNAVGFRFQNLKPQDEASLARTIRQHRFEQVR
jgi:hypothetical protein